MPADRSGMRRTTVRRSAATAHLLACVAVAAFSLTGVAPSLAQSYPARPVTLVVPVSPGGSATAVGRMIASLLEPRLHQTVIVDHRPGAGGYVGAQVVVNAKPDGYTLLLMPNSLMYPDLFTKGQAAVLSRDLMPVAPIAQTPYLVIVPSNLPVKTLVDFVAHAKANPDKLNVAVQTGIQQLDAVRFKRLTGLQMREIPYSGANEALPAMARGDVHLYFVTRASARAMLDEGRLLALAVGSGERFSAMPGIPTLKELGYDLELTVWYGIYGPSNMPADVVARLHVETSQALQSKEAVDALNKLSFDPLRATSAQLKAMVVREHDQYAAAAKAVGIAPQ